MNAASSSVGCRPASSRQSLRDRLGGIEHQPAVGQRQRLLRDDALFAAITFLDERFVERRQEQIAFVVRVEEVQAAPRRDRPGWPDGTGGPPRVGSSVPAKARMRIADEPAIPVGWACAATEWMIVRILWRTFASAPADSTDDRR